MSTILKALQKVEPESFGPGSIQADSKRRKSIERDLGKQSVRNGDPGAHQPLERQTGRDKMNDPSRLGGTGRKLIILMLIVLAMVGLWRYFNSSDSAPEKKPVQTFPIAKQAETQRVSKQVKLGDESTPQAQRLRDKVVKDQGAQRSAVQNQAVPNQAGQNQNGMASSSSGIAPPVKPSQKRDGIAKQPVDTQGTSRKTLSPSPPATGKKRAKKGQAGPSKRVKAKPTERKPLRKNDIADRTAGDKKARWQDAKPLENDRMILQALAWAPEPVKRMGVIDGLVVREGDDVNGFNVVAIQKRNIILQRDGKNYRLEFKSR